MNRNIFKKSALFLAMLTLTASILAACSQPNANENPPPPLPPASEITPNTESSSSQGSSSSQSSSSEPSSTKSASATELYVQFGDDGAPFTMHIYDNETAAAIARHVGTADWRIPLYDYEGYDNWEVMQYYDIPSRYEIPSNPETITQEVAGAVYYSQPNRIVLFYGDAQVSGEYTQVGYFDATPEFVSAVEQNPVLEGWGNKIIKISAER